MDCNKFILNCIVLCLCFQNVNAELDFLNESDFLEYMFNNTDMVEVIDWTEYDIEWNEAMNYHLKIPDDVDFISFPGKPISYVYLHPVQKYVKYNGTMFSDTIKPDVITGYKKGPMLFDSFSRSVIKDVNNELSCTFSCSWQKDKIVDDETIKIDKSKSLVVFTTYFNTTVWGNASIIDIILSNYTGGYLLLNFTVPPAVTAYTINIHSTNHSASYQKYGYLYTINKSHSLHYYDMVDADIMSFSGLIPFGVNRFYLPYETDYNISITVYTPFESKSYNYTNIYIENNSEEECEGNIEYIGFCFGFVFAIYYMYTRI